MMEKLGQAAGSELIKYPERQEGMLIEVID